MADGRWQGSVDLGWSNGRRRRKTVTRRTKAEVVREVRRLISECEAGRLTSEKPPTLAVWMRSYLDDVAPSRVRPSTLTSYRSHVEQHIVPELGHIRLDRLRPQHLNAFYQAKSRSLSAGSVRRLHALLRRALTIAVRWGLISTNPAQLVDPPSLAEPAIKPYTVEEARTFLAAARMDPLEARWLVGISLGLRQGEVLGLLWEDVDLEDQLLHVRHALQRDRDGRLVLVPTKTARSQRTVAMPPPVGDALRRWREHQSQARANAGDWHDTDFVFTTAVGTPIHPRNDYRAFRRLIEKAGLRRVRLHDLRHTTASLLLAQGVSARVAMEMLGHSQISVTMNTYTHVAPVQNRDAADRIGELLWPDE
jgi:integrase